MAIENINAYSERWQNGVSVGAMWDKIKAKFVSGAHDQTGTTAYPNTWKVQARVNLGLGNLVENSIWIGASGNTIAQLTTTEFGRTLLNATSNTRMVGLFADKAYRLDQASVGSLSLPVYVDANGRMAAITSLAVNGNVQSLQGGVSAMGIADLFSSVGGGGGGGTVTGVDFTQDVAYQQTGTYTPDDGIIHLPHYKWANIQDKPIVTTGSTNGTISYGGVDVAVYGLQALAYKASLSASDIPTIAISQVNGLQTALNNKLETSLKGAANGLAELDASQKIKLSQIPDVVLGQLVFGGTVNASGVATLSANAKTKTGITSNTVTLSNSAGTSSSYGWVRFEGCFFIMDADSSFASLDLKVGDWLLSTGTAWKKVDNTDAVTGVKGDAESSYRIGNVNITKANIGLGNVENTALSTWAGSQNITTLGTIATGVWHGTPIANDYLANKTIYINGTSFTLGDSATDNKLTEKWGKSRNIKIASSDGSNESAVVSVDGSAAVTLKLASTIKASLDGNASSATKLQNSRNIWGQAFDGTAEVSGNMSSVGNIAFNAGNHNIGGLLYFDMANGRIGIGTSTPQDKLGVQGDMSATGGVAAYGISDLSQSGGGGGGLSGTILRDWSQYDGSAEANQILSSYLGIEQFRMNGQKMQFMRNKTWVDGFTLAEGNIPDLTIGKITGVQSLTIKGGTTSIGNYSPSSALEFSIVAGTNISVTPDATNHKITIANTYSYTLPTASSSTKGGVKVGSGLTISNEVLSVSGVTNDMLSGSIANGKLASLGKFTIGSTAIELGQTYTQANFRSYLGLGTAATHAHGDYVTDLGTSGKTITWSKGGTAQTPITVPYAKQSTTLETESLTGQEFIFRNSPKTIGADSLKLDRILGRTLAWNQVAFQVVWNDMMTQDTSVLSERKYVVNADTSTSRRAVYVNSGMNVPKGHKTYISLTYKSNFTNAPYLRIQTSITPEYISINNRNYKKDQWQSFSGIIDGFIVGESSGVLPTNNNYNSGEYFSLPINGGIDVVDLTLLYGSAIDGMTDAQILAKFESEYPGYHSYNEGQLINNSAEGLETVGFNLWDEVVFKGTFSSEDGETKSVTDNFLATENKVPVIHGKSYYIKAPAASFRTLFYDANKKFITSVTNISPNTQFVMPDGVYYIRIQMGYQGAYNNDICINRSDPAKNGQYEPYKRNVLDLHLEEFKVKDSQGNIITITGGLKQAGDVRDEIVGGKLIRRVGNVDLETLDWSFANNRQRATPPSDMMATGASTPNWTCSSKSPVPASTDLSSNQNGIAYVSAGTPSIVCYASSASDVPSGSLNYELATPETYELVSPIPTAMPAGTTERRLPEDTADSVIAPFCADMTYGTNPGDILASGIAWEKIWGRPQLAKGSYSDSVISGSGEWFKLDVGGQVLYVQFAVGTGAFRLKIADSDDEDAATVSKEFAFATLSESDINAICV